MLTSNTLNSRRQQRGITLIEVSIGLIIAAIIAAAAFIAFQNNSRRSEVRENVAEITATLAELKQKFGRTGEYANLDTTVGISSGTIEQLNSYGGTICVVGAAAGATDCDGTASVGAGAPTNVAALDWPLVPADQCLDLVTSTMQGADDVYINGVAAAADGELLATAVCNATDDNVISWIVPIR